MGSAPSSGVDSRPAHHCSESARKTRQQSILVSGPETRVQALREHVDNSSRFLPLALANSCAELERT
jgi:hypothetical protein